MKTVLSSLTAVLLLLLSTAPVRGDDAAKNLAGGWRGIPEGAPVRLAIVFVISEAPGGGLKAQMYSPDQIPRPMPVDVVTVNGASLHIEVNGVRGIYEGTLDAAGTRAKGQWTQNGRPFSLELVKVPATDIGPTPEVLAPDDVAPNRAAAVKVAGTWNGALATPQGSLRLRVHIAQTGSGAAAGTIDSLDQNAEGIPIGAITLREAKFRFEARGIGGVYEGTLSADGSALAGQWTQAGHTQPLDLQKAKPE